MAFSLKLFSPSVSESCSRTNPDQLPGPRPHTAVVTIRLLRTQRRPLPIAPSHHGLHSHLRTSTALQVFPWVIGSRALSGSYRTRVLSGQHRLHAGDRPLCTTTGRTYAIQGQPFGNES